MKSSVIEAIEREKLIVIVRGIEKEKLLGLAEALYEGGIRLMEVTYKSDGSENELTAECIKMLSEHFEGRMYIGAGTVLTKEQVELTKAAGGKFIISPDAYSEVIKRTVELEMVSMPGVMTPTEIRMAQRCGADFVKLFPAVNMGPEYIKAVKAPLSDVKYLAVGGVDLDNMKEYLDAGVSGFGIGSSIIKKKMIAENDFEGITRLAKSYVERVK